MFWMETGNTSMHSSNWAFDIRGWCIVSQEFAMNQNDQGSG